MIKTVLRTTLVLSLAATTLVGTAEARGFGGGGFHGGGFHGGGFGGRGIAVGEPNPGIPHNGGFHHHGGWGHGFGWRGVGYTPFYSYGCAYRRVFDDFGNIVIRRVCN